MDRSISQPDYESTLYNGSNAYNSRSFERGNQAKAKDRFSTTFYDSRPD